MACSVSGSLLRHPSLLSPSSYRLLCMAKQSAPRPGPQLIQSTTFNLSLGEYTHIGYSWFELTCPRFVPFPRRSTCFRVSPQSCRSRVTGLLDPVGFTNQVTSFQALARSLTLLPLFLKLVSFIFNSLQALLQKHPGWGYRCSALSASLRYYLFVVFAAFVFIAFQIPFSASSFFSHPCKSLGGVG